MEMTELEKQHLYERLTHYINCVRGYPLHSGVKILSVGENRCEGELTITPDVCNYLGIVHGGCMATLADTVAGVAACSTGEGTVTLNYGFSFLRPATGEKIRCVAEPERAGRQIKVFRCSLYDDENKLVASGQFTFYMTGPLDMKAFT